MNIYEKLFPNIKRILDSGKDSVVKDPVQFSLKINPSLPQPTLPKTANTTQQIVKPTPIVAPTPVTPPIKTAINPLDIIRMGKEQVISQGIQQPKKVLTDGFFEGIFSGTGREEQRSLNFENKPFLGKAVELTKLAIREKGLLPGIGNLIFEGFNAKTNPTPEQYVERLAERVDLLTQAGVKEDEAWKISAQDIFNRSTKLLPSQEKVPQSDLGIKLTPEQEKILKGVNNKEKLFAVLDAPFFLGTTKPISIVMKTKGFLKPVKYAPEMKKAVNDFADLTNKTKTFTKEEATEIRFQAQQLADALQKTGHIAPELTITSDKALANTLRRHMDESEELITEAKRNTETPVNKKLQDFRKGKTNLQSGHIANPFQGQPTPKVDNQDVSLTNSSKLSPIDKLIAENKVRVVSRNGRDVYQVKKAGQWANVRDEDSAIKQATPKPLRLSAEGIPLSTIGIQKKKAIPLPKELDERLLSIEIAKEALDNNPAKSLAKFVSKRGDFKGTLAEVTGKQKSKTGIGIDVRSEDLGFKSTEEAREAYETYRTRKSEIFAEETRLKKEIKDFQTTARLKEKTVIPERAVDRVRELQKIAPEQVRSLEEISQQLTDTVDLPPNAKPDSLTKIVTQQTPVDKKVNFLDYIRTPDRVLEKIGFAKESKFLRSQYDKYVVELPKNIDKITEWTKRVPKESNERLFDYLDGKDIKLTPKEQVVADEIKEYLRVWANRLDLPEDKRVTNYITHLFEETLIRKEFDEDLAKIITDRVPGEVYNPFLQERLGAKGYRRDVWAALDAYTKRATRKVHLDPALEKIRERSGDLIEYTNLEESQFRFIQSYIKRVQMRPTEIDNLIDNGVKSIVGYRLGQRPVNRVSGFLRRMTYRGMLGANVGSALRNLSQGVNTYAVLGEKYTIIGYAKLFNTNARKELAEQGVLDNSFIQDRVLSSTKIALQKADKAIWFMFDQAEKINRSSAYFGAKAQGISKGMSEAEAIEYAKKIVRKTQFNYDSVDTPLILSSDLAKTLGQFQTYTIKQTEFLIELAKDKNFVGLMRYAIAGYIFVNTVGKAMGMEEKELLPYLRFDTPPSLKFPVESVKAAFNVPDKFGNIPDTEKKIENVGKSLLGLIPGGIQAKKTVEGIDMVEKGGSFDSAGRLQFEQTDTPAGKVQSVLFGKYASPQAKEYFKKDKKTGDKDLDKAIKEEKKQNAEQTEQVLKAVKEIGKLSTKEEKKAYLKNLAQTDEVLANKVIDKLTEEKKKETWTKTDKAIAGLGIENKARAKFIAKKLESFETKEEKKAYLKDLYEKGVINDTVIDQLAELKN